MKKIFLLFFVILFVSPSISQTSNPIRVGMGESGETFAFPEDIKSDSTGFSIRLIGNFFKPMPTTNGRFVKSIESYYTVVCQSQLVRLNRRVLLTGPMGTGDVLESAQAPPVWETSKDPALLSVINAFCK